MMVNLSRMMTCPEGLPMLLSFKSRDLLRSHDESKMSNLYYNNV